MSGIRSTIGGMSGPQKAAALMLAMGEEHAATLFSRMHEDEIRDLSAAMASLGAVPAPVIEELCHEFGDQLGQTGNLVGTYESTERLLSKTMSRERVSQIMEEIRGPAGRTMWDKLGNVNEAVLANYLKNEYPQTVAVVLTKVRPDHAARVLSLLPERVRDGGGDADAAHGDHPEGGAGRRRADAEGRVHVEPGARAAARRARDDGGDLQQPRPPGGGPHPLGARGTQPRFRRTHPRPDVHLRGPAAGRRRRRCRRCCARSRRTSWPSR